MSGVKFELAPGKEAVPVEIYDSEFALVDRVLSSQPVVTLEHGSYLAVGQAADGRELQAGFEVGAGSDVVAVDLEPSSSLRAHIEVAPPSALVRALRAAIRSVRRFDEPVIAEYALSGESEWTRVRRHRTGDRGWQQLDRLDVDALVVSHRVGQPMCVRVPRSAWPFLVVSLERADTDQASLDVRVANEQADALLRFLDRGEIGSAETLSKSPALSAEELLEGKRRDPIAAAAGAYALLRLGDAKRLHDWTSNLRSWFEWLPDGLVIDAEHMARAGDHQQAAKALRELPARGLPCFSAGVGFATDRLRSYARAWPEDTELSAALTYLTRFAVATDFRRPITTFTCTAPTHRSPQTLPHRPRSRGGLCAACCRQSARTTRAGPSSGGASRSRVRW